MRNRRIQVHLGPPRDGQPADFASLPPIINVHVACDPNWSGESDALPRHNSVVFAAMLDTGSEGTVIDSRIADFFPAAPKHNGLLSGFNGVSRTFGIDVQIIVPGANIVFPARVGVDALKRNGVSFDLVLGRDFLRNCCFICDGQRGTYSLQWGLCESPEDRRRGIRLPS